MNIDNIPTELIAEDLRPLETILNTLSTSPKECLYAVINESEKRIQIYSTSNFVSHVSRLAQEMNSLKYRLLRDDLNKVKVIILETKFRDKRHRDSLYREYTQQYKNNGWVFYSDRNIAQYKIHESYKYKNNVLYYVIELVTGDGRYTVVGVFSKYKEARDWKQTSYPNEDMITGIVVCDNDLTSSWNR